MTGPHRLLEWVGKQHDWARDALRRHALSPLFALTDEDKTQIVARVHQAAGIAQDQQHDHTPLEEDHLPAGATAGPRALLVSLGPVQNLGRQAKDQQLRFALDGLTLIYGDNASGKSGYCRITKKICRSLSAEELLGDVFAAGAKPPVEALVRFRVEGSNTIDEVTWKDRTPPPKAIRSISVFDSRNARLYIDKQNRVEFLPSQISLLESHGGHCKKMGEVFDAERKALEAQLAIPLPGGFTPGGTISNTIAQLALRVAKLPTVKELTALAAWSDADKQELEALNKALAQDPTALAAREDRCKAALKILLGLVPNIEAGLSSAIAEDLKSKVSAAAAATQAAALAAEDAFSSEPLPEVGQDAWRQMYDHAKAYVIAAELGAELPSEAGDLCALCQQPLSATASERLKRFQTFVLGEAANKATETATALKAAVAALAALSIPAKTSIVQSLAEYRASNAAREKLASQLETYFASAEARRKDLTAACASGDFDTLTALPSSILASLTAETETLAKNAEEFRDQAKLDTKRAKSVSRQNELKDCEKLHGMLAAVLARRANLERHQKITECARLVGTQQLSTFITTYRRELFTEALETRIQTEIDNFDLGHIPFAVSDKSEDGHSLVKVGLKAPVVVENEKVLSEGEQRALALACFLAEVGGDEAKNGLVIDDPVSSLDHLRIRRVAKRLVEEAGKGRQVIVFTHNLLFYNEVLQAAAAAEPQVPVARRVISKSSAKGFGIVSEESEPWTAQKITTRISRLQARRAQLETEFTDFNTDEYRRAAKDFYTDLRETWERLVEELLLGQVVERYHSEVKTQSLKQVEVDDDDYRTVFFAMKHVSERSGHDMPAGKQIPTPTPTDMKADLQKIDDYRAHVAQRRKKTEERRKAKESPPAAQVA